MKGIVSEKSLVVVLFVLVIIAFAFAERDTQKAFEQYNKKSTVENSKKTTDYTATASEKKETYIKSTRN